MKRTYTILCMLLVILSLFGARIMNQPVTITQPDGTNLSILASGDEFHNWLHDTNNYTIIQDSHTGWYTYAVKADNKIIASQYIAGQSNPAALGLEAGVNLTAEQRIEKRRLCYGDNTPSRNGRAPHFGTINNLVVFIKFSDSPAFNQDITYFNDMFNTSTTGYNSMRNYFQAVSYNQLNINSHFYPNPNNNTVVCYVDSFPRAYYMPLTDTNPMGYDEYDYQSRTSREFSLLTSAINSISNQIPPSLDLDADDDGDIDNVCFIVQGSTTAWATLLWPHRWSIYDSQSFINGARVYDFNFQLESFLGSSGNSVLCHEMTHTLGAPDLYRYDDDTIDPIGPWDLMCGNSNPPQSMSAWMKFNYLDWVTTVPTISQSGTYSINSVWSEQNNIIRIPSWRVNEYYLVEYRKPFGIYDSTLPGTGLLVYRLNTNENGNASGPPDELYIYRPNGTSNFINGNLNLAFFSQQSGRTNLSESTIPNGFLSNGFPGGLDISQISASGGETMSFHVNVSDIQLTYPRGNEAFFSGSSQVIAWKARNYNGSIKIEFSTNNGQSWQTIIASAANNGSYLWQNIPVLDSNQCLVRVTNLSTNSTDTINFPFSIFSSVAAPVAVFPSNQMVNAPTNPTFKWNAVPGADSYCIQVAGDNEFNNIIVDVLDSADTTYTFNSLTPFTSYYWRVATVAIIGFSGYSPINMFTTGQITEIPAIPVQVLPPNYAVYQPMSTTISWSEANFAYFYHYQVSTNNYFTNIIAEEDSVYTLQAVLSPLNPSTRYYWRVRAGNPAGYSTFTNIHSFETANFTSIEGNDVPQIVTNLKQNQPNPFKQSTQIDFDLKNTSTPAKLTIYNLKGQIVKVLFNGLAKSSTNNLTWNGTDTNGIPVSNGIYYYKLETTGYKETKKMLLLK